jgi:hypothetical protein
MPTFAYTPTFGRDFAVLDPADKQRFRKKVTEEFVPDLARGKFRVGLWVKRVYGARGIFEMTWAPNGRATFEYGEEQIAGESHVIWRRVGTHDAFRAP